MKKKIEKPYAPTETIQRSTAYRLSFMLSVISEVILGAFVLHLIPDILDTAYIESHYISDPSNFVAEKSEFFTYVFVTLSFPFALISWYQILKNSKLSTHSKLIPIIDVGGIVLLTIIMGMLLFSKSIFFYISEVLPSKEWKNILLFGISLIIFAVAAIFGIQTWEKWHASLPSSKLRNTPPHC